MPRKLTLLLFFFISYGWTLGQAKPTYHGDIEPILLKNCVSCHKPGGIGPFSLQTYEEVKAKGNFIGHVTKTKYMPPWKADPTYQTF
ncbi:MAG TPA: cytochrome c, partial [Cyclobacteriaceae bacterium]|nr:cytochrome c [Cyclobacteriaceae bacterium]